MVLKILVNVLLSLPCHISLCTVSGPTSVYNLQSIYLRHVGSVYSKASSLRLPNEKYCMAFCISHLDCTLRDRKLCQHLVLERSTVLRYSVAALHRVL